MTGGSGTGGDVQRSVPSPRWLIVSNGHGEDHIAALLALEVRRRLPTIELLSLPLVGEGRRLAEVGVERLEPRVELPSSGLTMHHPRHLWADLRAGLLALTAGQLRTLRAARCDRVLVVGDVYAHALAALVPAPRSVVQTLVSVRMQRPGAGALGPRRYMEGFRWPELPLMRARRVEAVYVRDAPSAEWLRQRGVRARHLGNVMMDGAVGGRTIETPPGRPVVALLPGSRAGADASAALMLEALTQLGPVTALVAWTRRDAPAPPPGWRALSAQHDGAPGGLLAVWQRGEREVWWLADRFRDVLASADAALGTTGTAQEQAAGLGVPVVTFVHPPLTRAFLANQQRLLGAALLWSAAQPQAIAATLQRALDDEAVRAEAARAGRERMGPAGATALIAEDLLASEAG